MHSAASLPKAPRRRLRALLALSALVSVSGVAAGCYFSNEGVPPPLDALYFPTGLVVSPGRSALYVTNSDFDLQYNGGTVLGLDLRMIRPKLTTLAQGLAQVGSSMSVVEACSLVDELKIKPRPDNENELLYPGPCAPLPLAPFVGASVTIGAFASGAALVSHPEREQARLFVPVRGDRTITYLEIADDRQKPESAAIRLDCGGDELQHRCGEPFQIGRNPYANTRNLSLPVEPVGIAASGDGEGLLVAHQTEDSVSLIVNPWLSGDPGDKPELEYISGNLPKGPTEVASVDVPRVVEALREAGKAVDYQPGFLVSYRASPQIDLFRYYDDAGSSPRRPFVVRAGVAAIDANGSGTDSRGIAVDPSARDACESACAQAALDCLRDCAAVPLRIFVANRAPPSLLVGRVETTLVQNDGDAHPTAAFDRVFITDSIPLAIGASKVAVGKIIDAEGIPRVRAFAAAFDSRLVFSYDPEAHRVEATIRTGRGPHAMAFDTEVPGAGGQGHSFLFIGHFTDSYIGVVDLDMRRPETYGTMIATLGTPTPPRESK